MDKREVIVLIKKKRQLGLTDEQIKAALINSGFSEEEINANIENSYKEPDPTLEELSAAEEDNKPKKKWWPF